MSDADGFGGLGKNPGPRLPQRGNVPYLFIDLGLGPNDLIEAAASPGNNERLQFVRQLLVSRGIDPSTDAGQNQAWTYLAGIRDRVNREALTIEQRARV